MADISDGFILEWDIIMADRWFQTDVTLWDSSTDD